MKTRMLQGEKGKKDSMKRRREKDDKFFFRAVNNTFLQISQQRKHKCERERERDYVTRNRERENKNKNGHRCTRAPCQGTFLNDTVIGFSILISYIDTYPLCDNSHVTSYFM